MIAEALVAALVVVGGLFTLVGSVGLIRFPDFFTRLHGPTKASTLGVGSLLVAAVIHLTAQGEDLKPHKALIAVFLFLTAPVSAHLLARAALTLRVPRGEAGDADPEFQHRGR